MSFESAFDSIKHWEGIYDNDPDDSGGETCFGITKRYAPQWVGWQSVDQLKANGIPVYKWDDNAKLMQAVKDFYQRIWDDLALGKVKDEAIANAIFGGAINQGQTRMVKWVQAALMELGQPVDLDGQMGPQTIRAIDVVLSKQLGSALLDKIISKRARAYTEAVVASPKNGKYLAGWLNRLFGGA